MINHKLHVNHQLWHCDTSNGEKTFSNLNLTMWSVKMRTLKSRDKDFSLYFSEVKRRLFVPERKTLKSIQSVIVNIKWAPLIGWHTVRNKKALFKFRNILSRKLFGQEALQSRVRILVRSRRGFKGSSCTMTDWLLPDWQGQSRNISLWQLSGETQLVASSNSELLTAHYKPHDDDVSDFPRVFRVSHLDSVEW